MCSGKTKAGKAGKMVLVAVTAAVFGGIVTNIDSVSFDYDDNKAIYAAASPTPEHEAITAYKPIIKASIG